MLPRHRVRWGSGHFVGARTSSEIGVSYILYGVGVLRTITIPGVQKPHWLPLLFAILSCAGCGCFTFPIPSTVMTCLPSTLTSGARQALTEAWYTFLVVGLYCDTT